MRVENPQDVGSTPPAIIDITGLPSFIESMFGKAQITKERLNEGVHGGDDHLQSLFDGVDSTATEDATGLGDLKEPRKSPSSGAGGSNSRPRLVNRFPAPSANLVPKDARGHCSEGCSSSSRTCWDS